MKTSKPPGFTLTELLIVLAIMSLLMQMLLPAVQMARESARQTQCQNNLRQLALAAQLHVSAHEFFPSGGWTHVWVGDPNRGFGREQPGGWCYNLLPYIEQQVLHDLGQGAEETMRQRLGAEMFATPLPVFTCPSRRLTRAWPFVAPDKLINIDIPEKAGRSDYAANIGNLTPFDQRATGPLTLAEGDLWQKGDDRETSWVATQHNGIVFQRSEVRPAMVLDGLSKTYFAGEKFLDPAQYKRGLSNGDDHSLYVGFDRDNARSGNTLHPPMRDKNVPLIWLRYGDNELVTDWNFGSAHPTGLHMALCDGSVRMISYTIETRIHAAMSSRDGGEDEVVE